MLYVIHGKETHKSRKKLTELVDSLLKKRPDASLFRLNSENWNEAALNELIQSQGLFLPKYIIVLDQLLALSGAGEIVLDHIKELAESDHICILFEEKLKAADKKVLEKYADKIQEYGAEEAPKKEAPRTFALADAIAIKDSKRAWVVLQELMKKNTAAEEIHGVLWWQFKSILLSRTSKNAKDAGLSPFVYQKAARAAGAWKDGELESVVDRLVSMYHRAHRGEIDFNVELEKFILFPVEKAQTF